MKLFLPALAALVLVSQTHATPKTKGASLQFVSDVKAVQPGVPFTVALHIQHQKGFHTYWKAPGIVGLATSIEWTLPPGFQAGPIQWPAPKIVDMATHPAHGFHRDVLLCVEITPPARITTDTITLTGALAWMACAKACYPGFADRSITLPVQRGGRPLPDEKWAPAIAKERMNLPVPTDLWTVTLESPANASPIKVRIRPTRDASRDPGEVYFFSEDGQISSEPPQRVERQPDGSFLVVAARSEFGPENVDSLPGTLVASAGWDQPGELRAFRAEPTYARN